MSVLLVLLAVGQTLQPLRKSDLVRLLSGSALSQQEIVRLVSRNCLAFDPTERDRQDLRRLGAAPPVLTAVDDCVRRRARRQAARPASASRTPPPPPPPTPAPVTTPGPATAQPVGRVPPAPPASDERSAFAAGGGQSGVAGARLARPLVFDVRDSSGTPLTGQTVTFTGINARTTPASATSDKEGRVRVAVVLGERAGSATVIATVGVVEKQVAFNVSAGPVAHLVLACGGAELTGRFVMRRDSFIVLDVTAQDALGNATRVAGVRAAVADSRIFRVTRVGHDSARATITLEAEQAGTTSLAVIAAGIRQYWTGTVLPRGGREPPDCR